MFFKVLHIICQQALFCLLFMRHGKEKCSPSLNRGEGSGKAAELHDVSTWWFSMFSLHFLAVNLHLNIHASQFVIAWD